MKKLGSLRVGFLVMMLLAMLAVSACDKVKTAYCTSIVPLLTDTCNVPAPVPTFTSTPRG